MEEEIKKIYYKISSILEERSEPEMELGMFRFYKSGTILPDDLELVRSHLIFMTKLYGFEIQTIQELSNKQTRITRKLDEKMDVRMTDASGDRHMEALRELLQLREQALESDECEKRYGEELMNRIRDLETTLGKNRNDVVQTCSNLIWGKQSLEKYPIPPTSPPEISGHMETIQDGIRYGDSLEYQSKQRVFGFSTNLQRYKPYRAYFHINGMFDGSDYFADEPCDRMLEYTLTLNKLAILCGLYSESNSVRFIFPKGRLTFPDKKNQWKYQEIEDFGTILGVVVLQLKEPVELFPEKKIFYLAVRPKQSHLDYGLHSYKAAPVVLFSGFLRHVPKHRIFSMPPTTTMEHRILFCTIKDSYFYRSNINSDSDTDLYFVSRKKLHEKPNYSQMNLTRVEIVCLTDKKTYKKIYVLVDRLTSPEKLKELYPELYIYENEKTSAYYISEQKLESRTQYDTDRNLNPLQMELVELIRSNQLVSIHPVPQSQKGGTRAESRANSFLKSEFRLYDEEVASRFYRKFVKYDRKIITEFDFNLKESFTFYNNYYPYYYLRSAYPVGTLEYQTQTLIDREFLVKKFQDQEIQGIVIYQPVSPHFFSNYELLVNNNIRPGNSLEICNMPGFVESLFYYNNKYFQKNIKYHVVNLSDYAQHISQDRVRTISDSIKRIISEPGQWSSTVKFDSFPKINDIRVAEKYNLIVSTFLEVNSKHHSNNIQCSKNEKYRKSHTDNFYISDYTNLLNFMEIIIFTLQNLEKNGTFIFRIYQIVRYCVADLVLVLQKCFDNVDIYVPELNNPSFVSGHFVICKKFHGNCTDMIQKLIPVRDRLKEVDQLSVNCKVDFFTMEIKEKFDYIEKLDPSTEHNGDRSYHSIKEFNQEYYLKKYMFVKNLYKILKTGKSDTSRIRNKQLTESILWTKKYDMESKQPDNFYQLVVQDMFSFHKYKILDFKYTAPGSKMLDFPKIETMLKRIKSDILLTNILIDTRDINKWYQIKNMFQFYRPSNRKYDLVMILQKDYRIYPVSQAWLKMYEMLIHIGLVKDSRNLNTFHICEAPGNFIMALDYYIKHHTKIKDFDWKAQSLNPYEPTIAESMKKLIGDTYGLIKKNPEKWIFGADNTGDITSYQNIRHYIKYFKDKKPDLITADCGIAYSEESECHRLAHVVFCQWYVMLRCLKKGGNFVSKVFLPILYPMELSMIYLFYSHFETLIFFKGVVNPNSKEFYIIGLNYKDDLGKNVVTGLKENTKNFDIQNQFGYTKYPEEFVYQLKQSLEELANNFIFVIKRQIYYVDNYENLDKGQIFKYIDEKNKDWIKINKIQKN